MFTCLVAVCFLDPAAALFTHDLAAPHELAATVLQHVLYDGVVTSTAAHQAAPVQPIAAPLTLPPPGAQGATHRVELTEVGRVLEVNQVMLTRLLLHAVYSPQAHLVRVELDFAGAVIFLLQLSREFIK